MKPTLKGLYAIVDNTAVPHLPHVDLARALLEGGARLLQLRMKSRPPKEVTPVAKQILQLKREFEFTFLINDYPELARELGADGYHGGRDDPPVEAVREKLGPHQLIGYSAHSAAEAIEAASRGADYVAFGAIYRSPSKGHDHPIQEIERLREVVLKSKIPVVAIGGIGRHNIREVLATGVASIAMISSLIRPTLAETINETKFYSTLLLGGIGITGRVQAFGRKGPTREHDDHLIGLSGAGEKSCLPS